MGAKTHRELVVAQIAHYETDPLPYCLSMEDNVAERLDAHYGGDAWRELLQSAIVRWAPAVTGVLQPEGAESSTDIYGSRWQVNRRPFHLVEPALTEASLSGYAFPEMKEIFPQGWEADALAWIDQQRARGCYVAAGLGFGLFERTWTLRGFNEAMMDAALNPAFYDSLAESVAEHQLAILDRLLALPFDGIMFSDDWGYQRGVLLGPDRWRRFIKPRLARLYARVHRDGRHTLSHCCGSVVSIMPDIVEIGLDVLESVQPEAAGMNPYALKREYGGDITFWGGLGSQSTIPFGAPAEIKAEIARLCREMGQGGGYVLGPSKGLQPETPTLNAAAVVEGFLAQAGVTLG